MKKPYIALPVSRAQLTAGTADPVEYRTVYTVDKRGQRAWKNEVPISDYRDQTKKELEATLSLFKKKAVKRLKTFYEESKRSDKKVEEIFKKLAENGIELVATSIVARDLESAHNGRKRPKALSTYLTFKKGEMTFSGSLIITPCVVRLYLCSPQVEYNHPVYSIVYFKNLVFRDNTLAAFVKGKMIKPWEKEPLEIPF